MLFIALIAYTIGQFIDIVQSIKSFILSVIVLLMIFKVIITNINDQDQT